MSMIRRNDTWDPFRDLDDVGARLTRLFGRNGGNEQLALADWSPACNVSETDAEYRVHAELPGVEKADVKVALEQGILTIQGERKQKREEKNEKMHRVETAYGRFVRRFAMPDDTDPEKVLATFDQGVLDVRIAKLPAPKKTAREIPIR